MERCFDPGGCKHGDKRLGYQQLAAANREHYCNTWMTKGDEDLGDEAECISAAAFENNSDSPEVTNTWLRFLKWLLLK